MTYIRFKYIILVSFVTVFITLNFACLTYELNPLDNNLQYTSNSLNKLARASVEIPKRQVLYKRQKDPKKPKNGVGDDDDNTKKPPVKVKPAVPVGGAAPGAGPEEAPGGAVPAPGGTVPAPGGAPAPPLQPSIDFVKPVNYYCEDGIMRKRQMTGGKVNKLIECGTWI